MPGCVLVSFSFGCVRCLFLLIAEARQRRTRCCFAGQSAAAQTSTSRSVRKRVSCAPPLPPPHPRAFSTPIAAIPAPFTLVVWRRSSPMRCVAASRPRAAARAAAAPRGPPRHPRPSDDRRVRCCHYRDPRLALSLQALTAVMAKAGSVVRHFCSALRCATRLLAAARGSLYLRRRRAPPPPHRASYFATLAASRPPYPPARRRSPWTATAVSRT